MAKRCKSCGACQECGAQPSYPPTVPYWPDTAGATPYPTITYSSFTAASANANAALPSNHYYSSLGGATNVTSSVPLH